MLNGKWHGPCHRGVYLLLCTATTTSLLLSYADRHIAFIIYSCTGNKGMHMRAYLAGDLAHLAEDAA